MKVLRTLRWTKQRDDFSPDREDFKTEQDTDTGCVAGSECFQADVSVGPQSGVFDDDAPEEFGPTMAVSELGKPWMWSAYV